MTDLDRLDPLDVALMNTMSGVLLTRCGWCRDDRP